MRGAARLVAIVCAAQVLAQLDAGYWPVLLPDMMKLWSLSNSEAGWITSGEWRTLDFRFVSSAIRPDTNCLSGSGRS